MCLQVYRDYSNIYCEYNMVNEDVLESQANYYKTGAR
jgi:hypothetical protein